MPGCGSAWKAPWSQDLPEQVAQQPAGQGVPVGAEAVQLGAGVADADAVEPLQHQEPAGGDVGVHGGDEHGGVGRGCGSDHRDVAGLDTEVQFLGQGVGEAAAEVADVVGAGPVRPGIPGGGSAGGSCPGPG